jgi:hypothetical protein
MATTYEKIATTTLSSAAATIDFTAITGTYTDIRLVLSAIGTSIGTTIRMRFNSDTGTNYSYSAIYGDSASAAVDFATLRTFLVLGMSGTDTTNPVFHTVDLMSYSGSTFKTNLVSSSEDMNGSGYVSNRVTLWRNTAAITSINLLLSTSTFAAGTTATLYGILKA